LAIAFNRLKQYTSSPGNRAYCYRELAVSSLLMAETIVRRQYSLRLYPRRDGHTEYRPGWLG